MTTTRLAAASLAVCFTTLAPAAPATNPTTENTHQVTVGTYGLGATSYPVKSRAVCGTAIREAALHFGNGQDITIATCTELNTGRTVERCESTGGYKGIPRSVTCTIPKAS